MLDLHKTRDTIQNHTQKHYVKKQNHRCAEVQLLKASHLILGTFLFY